jgi:hypothetical protein
MFSKLLSLVPDSIIDAIYNAIFAELVRRGNIVFEEDWNSDDRN